MKIEERTYLYIPHNCFTNIRKYDVEKLINNVAYVENKTLLKNGKPALKSTKKCIKKKSNGILKTLDYAVASDTLKTKVSVNQIDTLVKSFTKKKGPISAHCFLIVYAMCDIIASLNEDYDFTVLSEFSYDLFTVVNNYYKVTPDDDLAFYCIQSYDALQKKLANPKNDYTKYFPALPKKLLKN